MLSTLKSFGLDILRPAIDGKIHRCDGTRKNKKDGWYIAREYKGKVYCAFGDFYMGESGKWSEGNGSTVTAQDKVAWAEIARIAEEEAKKLHSEAATKAQAMIDTASPASPDHPYLTKKGIKPNGALQHNDIIITPMYLSDGTVTGYQSISPDGSKRYLYGMEKKGSAFIINGKGPMCICEGFATGATIHEATGRKVLCAMDSGNLIHVARTALKGCAPEDMIICADNDHVKEAEGKGNAGIKAAKAIKDELGIDYVCPQGITGTDFNDMAAELGIKAVKKALTDHGQAEVLTSQEITEDNRQTDIPEDLLHSRGLISAGLRAVYELSTVNILQYQYPTVISLLSAALAGKIRVGHVHPSCFFIKIGGTSTGKTDLDKYVKANLFPHFMMGGTVTEPKNTLYGVTDFASGTGLLRAIQSHPQCLITLDEISFLFMKIAGRVDTNAQSKTKAILELSTSAGMRFERPYADTDKTIAIEYPVVNMLGNTTPGIFKTFSLDDLQSGLIQRFDFFCYDGQALKRNGVLPIEDSLNISGFIDGLKALHLIVKPAGRSDLTGQSAVDVGLTLEAAAAMSVYSDVIIEIINSHEDEGLKGLVSRKYNAALKFALIHSGATRLPEDIFHPLELADIQYGIALADLLCDWKLRILAPNLHAGDFDTLCRAFMEGAKICIKRGQKPYGKTIVDRRPRLKNLPPKVFDDIVKVLKARGEIRSVETGGKTTYEPLKRKKEGPG